MKKGKLIAAIAAATMAVTTMSSMPFFASADNYYKDHYDTYRVYVDLKPASGMQQSYIVITYRRLWARTELSVQGNVPGNIRTYGSAGDIWANGVKYFDATADVTDGGTLYRWNFCSDYNTTNFWDIAKISTNETRNSAGNIIEPNPVEVSAVLVGDLNNDNVVNWEDVSVMNKYLNGSAMLTDNAIRAADTDNNGYVDRNDLSMLISYADGTIANFLLNQ